MATSVISGIGEIQIRDNTNNVLFIGGFASVELQPKTDIKDAKRYNTAGQLVLSDSYKQYEEYELKITQQVSDSLGIGLGIGEIPALQTSVPYYAFIEASVPLTTPFTIPVATKITTALGNATTVLVTAQASGVWNSASSGQTQLNLTPGTATPATGTFYVDVSTVGSEKITFNSAQAGMPVLISYLTTASNKLAVGLGSTASTAFISKLYFSAKLISSEFPNGCIMMCPSISKLSGLSYKTGDVPTIENNFKVGTPAGSRSPVQLVFL
jgi:hypothetical protein